MDAGRVCRRAQIRQRSPQHDLPYRGYRFTLTSGLTSAYGRQTDLSIQAIKSSPPFLIKRKIIERKIMRAILIVSAFALGSLPASAQTSNRNWVKSGTEGALTICVDQNSIVKRADGLTQYVMDLFCRGKNINLLRVEAVNCDQDMSGQNFPMQGRPFPPNEDGSYEFAAYSTKSCSLAGQTAKFVCKKPGPHKSC
jgi:hypothetical protein